MSEAEVALAISNIARRHRQGLITYEWALYLAGRAMRSSSRWDVLAAFSEEVGRQLREQVSHG